MKNTVVAFTVVIPPAPHANWLVKSDVLLPEGGGVKLPPPSGSNYPPSGSNTVKIIFSNISNYGRKTFVTIVCADVY